MLLRGLLIVGGCVLLLCSLSSVLVLSAGASLLAGKSITLDNAPSCTSENHADQTCLAPNDVAAEVVQWAKRIADHLNVEEPHCGTNRWFPDCLYTWKDAGFPEAVTHYSQQWCKQTGNSDDCLSFWGLSSPERFQCVSLVRGAYSQVYPMPTSDDAFRLWDDYKDKKGWKAITVSAPGKYPHGLPRPGDIVIIRKFSDQNAGHTGIVTDVSAPNAQGDRLVQYANANSGTRYDHFTVHRDNTVPYLWHEPEITVWGYLRPDLPQTTITPVAAMISSHFFAFEDPWGTIVDQLFDTDTKRRFSSFLIA